MEVTNNECDDCVIKIWEEGKSFTGFSDMSSAEYAQLIGLNFCLILVLVCD